MFQRRHYEAIADMLLSSRPQPDDNARAAQWNYSLTQFVLGLERDNVRFLADRFIKRAGGYCQ